MQVFNYTKKWLNELIRKILNAAYIKNGQKPWTKGYRQYKETIIRDVLSNDQLFDCFSQKKRLPPRYGYRITERVVEFPWLFSKLHNENSENCVLLDAGSSLNVEYVLNFPEIVRRQVIIYNLPQKKKLFMKDGISYILGDLRDTILKNECIDEIACISVLEHIGMDNTFLYSGDQQHDEFKPDDYQDVVVEFKRLLKDGGRLFISVPFGRYENHGWLQQFDHKMVAAIMDVFAGSSCDVTYYKYADGWQLSDAEACKECSYFDFHNRDDYESDYVAAARAVACIELVK